MRINTLLQALDIPVDQRVEYLACNINASIYVYHMTGAKNKESIMASGLQARECEQSYVRPAAVYFFLDLGDCNPDNSDNLGIVDPIIIKIAMPLSELLRYGHYDGLYNMMGISYSAVQYRSDIPAGWITA